MESSTSDPIERNVANYLSWKKRTRIRPALERSIFAPYWDDLASFLFRKGYTWYTVRRVIEIATPLAAYVAGLGVRDATGLTDDVIRSYSEARPRNENRRCLRLVLLFFRDRGLIADADALSDSESASAISGEYLAFLRDHRGTSERTARQHWEHVEALLSDLGNGNSTHQLRCLTGLDIQRFIMRHAEPLSRSARKVMCAAIRTFLRFLYVRGYTPLDLASAVPVIPSFKLERLPTTISTDAIQRILGAVDRSTTMGRRDYAMLLLLATYGLRAGQLCALRLEDIDWRGQSLHIPGAKGSKDHVFPLHPTVGEAMVDYLRNGRPHGYPFREVFLRVYAPIGPLRGVLRNQIKRYADLAGVQADSLGSHAWRHACATRMLESGHSLKTIRHMLGHASIQTTFIYTKVNLGALRDVALEWPEVPA